MEDYKFLFKVVLVGNAGVGKTCLVRRFTQGLFPPGQGATIGVDFMIKTVEVDNEKVKVSTCNAPESYKIDLWISSCKFGTQLAKKGFALLHRVITGRHTL